MQTRTAIVILALAIPVILVIVKLASMFQAFASNIPHGT